MTKLNIDRLCINKDVKKEDFKTYSIIDGNKYLTYKVVIDEKKLRSLKEELVLKYSDYETITKTDVRIDGPRGIRDTFMSGNIEVIDSVAVNTRSNSYDNTPVFGGPVYADIVADIKRHPGIEMIINKLLLEDKIDLSSLYKYVCELVNEGFSDIAEPIKKGPIIIKKCGFGNSIILSKNEKMMNNDELENIFNSIFECFVTKDLEVKDMVNGQLNITTDITVEELSELKENLEIAKKNGQIVNSKITASLFEHNNFVKQKGIENK